MRYDCLTISILTDIIVFFQIKWTDRNITDLKRQFFNELGLPCYTQRHKCYPIRSPGSCMLLPGTHVQ